MNARARHLGLVLVAAVLGCKEPNPRCLHDADCSDGQICNPGGYCVAPYGGSGGAAGSHGGAGGAGGGSMGGAGGKAVCPRVSCPGTAPVCDVDAGQCRGCTNDTSCRGLDAGTNRCVTADAGADGGAALGTCVGCLSSTDCQGATPICAAHACSACALDKDCANADPAKPVCVTSATASLAKGMCVGCLAKSNCGGKTPICNGSNVCAPCSLDSDCAGTGPAVCMTDGHCATDAETIYVKDDTASVSPTCTDTPAPSDGGVGAATAAHPFCTMQPVATYLSTARDLVVVSGVVSAGTWSYTNQVAGGQLSIVGQNSAKIASSTSPGFSQQAGTAYIRAVKLSSSASFGIKTTGGTLTLQRVVVDQCSGGGISLSGTTFDLENTTVTANGPGASGTNGGIIVATAGTGSVLNFVTVANNNQIGITCDGKVAGNGVYAAGNSGGQVATLCMINYCTTLSSSCGAQP